MGGKSSIFTYFKTPINSGRNIVILVTGKVGTGKSYSGLTVCEQLDKNFNVDRVCFTAKQFLNLLNKETNLKKGSAILLDEVGIVASARTFQSDINKILSHVFQIFRHRRLIVVMTLPHEKMVDVHLRMSTDYRIETHSIIKNEKLVKAKVFELRMLHGVRAIKSGMSFYEKIPRANIDGVIKKLKWVYFPKPSPALCKAYEKKAEAYKLGVVAAREAKIIAKENAVKEQAISKQKQVMQEVQAAPNKFMKERYGKLVLDAAKIALEYDMSLSSARQVIQLLGAIQ